MTTQTTTIRPDANRAFPRLPNGLHSVALGDGSRYDIALLATDDGRLVVSVLGYGAYAFSGFAHASYLREKLRLGYGDAGNLADFINDQIMDETEQRQGHYESDLLSTK